MKRIFDRLWDNDDAAEPERRHAVRVDQVVEIRHRGFGFGLQFRVDAHLLLLFRSSEEPLA